MNSSDWDALPAVFGVEELAQFLGIGKASAYNLAHRRGFPVIMVGRQIRISREGLRRWIEKQELDAAS